MLGIGAAAAATPALPKHIERPLPDPPFEAPEPPEPVYEAASQSWAATCFATCSAVSWGELRTLDGRVIEVRERDPMPTRYKPSSTR